MKYVLDSSVALKWVLPEADSVKAIRLGKQIEASPQAACVFPTTMPLSLSTFNQVRNAISHIPQTLPIGLP